MTKSTHIGVVGAGILGLAVARRIAQVMTADVTILDKESSVATHQTGRNSNVVHSGVYYKPGSLKAVLTRRGVDLLSAYCRDRELPYAELGKVIVAVDNTELPRLHDLAERAKENGIPDTRLIEAEELREREPYVSGIAALLIPSTAVVEFPAVARALADDVLASGGEMKLGQEVHSIATGGSNVLVQTSKGELEVDHLVVCAGLQSSQLAGLMGAPRDPEIIPFRGEYYELVPNRSDLVRGLVYPVPDPRYPFLGVHFTPSTTGHVHVGPNAVLALAQEGYRWKDVSLRDLRRLLTYPGMWRLAAQHWRTGVREVIGSASQSVFLRRAQVYIPTLTRSDIKRAGSGVRAQAVRTDGTLVDDFVIDQLPGVTLVRNAPSPGATASLAIAEHVVARVLEVIPRP